MSKTAASSPGSAGVEEEGGVRYDCRDTYENFRFEAEETREDEERPPTSSFRCGQWNCYCCGYRMRMNLVEEVQRVVSERPEMRRFLTLTLDRGKLPAEVRDDHKALTEHLMETWRKFRTYVEREYGQFSFIWVKEQGDENEDHWHLHVLVSQYMEQEWVSEAWSAVGGGEVVDIRYVDRCEKVGHYLGKYLTKNALSGFPKHVQRYNSSEDIELDVRGSESVERSFELLMEDYTVGDEPEVSATRPVVGEDFIDQKQCGGPLVWPPPDDA